jgi:hypothetical protein
MRVAKQAGRFELECYTDGHPLWTEIHIDGGAIGKFAPEDLRDLKYCIDRMLARIEGDKP